MEPTCEIYHLGDRLFRKISLGNEIVSATLDGKPVEPKSYDSLMEKFKNSLLQKMGKCPMHYIEILNYYTDALPKLATTEDEKRIAEYLISSKFYQNEAHEIIAELELARTITSEPGIIEGRPNRLYKLARGRSHS